MVDVKTDLFELVRYQDQTKSFNFFFFGQISDYYSIQNFQDR